VVELCSLTWWKFPDVTWRCVEKLSSNSTSTQGEAVLTIDVWVGILFIFCAGILGSVIVELLYNKSDWYLTPLVNRVVRRYNFTVERNRLRSMNGHP